jgi:hypothetical protein
MQPTVITPCFPETVCLALASAGGVGNLPDNGGGLNLSMQHHLK